jgi:hypothetical protein
MQAHRLALANMIADHDAVARTTLPELQRTFLLVYLSKNILPLN